jgi:phage terminase large subunit-like protein
MPLASCGECAAGRFGVTRHRVVHLTYDPYQMESITQRLRYEVWCKPFPQGQAREIADSRMHKLALRSRLSHRGDPQLRENILNARAKLSRDEDSKMRMIKRSPSRKIDLAVAASMAIDRCLYLNLT